MKARTQITVAATAVVALLVALTGQFIVYRTDQRDRDDIDHALAARAAQIQTDATKTGKLPADGVYSVRLMSGTQVRAQSGSTTQFSAPVRDGFSTVAAADGHDYRSWAETLKTGVQLQVLTDYSDQQGRHSQAVRLVDLSVLVAILLGGLASWFASGIVLRPLRRLEEGARELRPDDLSGRLPSVKEPREVAEIAASVNALLDRMQAAAESGTIRPAESASPSGPPFAPPTAPAPAAAPKVSRPPNLPEPTTSTITPPPAEPDTFPPRPAPVAARPVASEPTAGRPTTPTVEKERDDEELRAALEKLGDDLDTLLDNPELSTTQRHLMLASIQNEYRRIVLLTQAP
ncbi:HAMP domain-containing protein [Actinoplanes sp. NPDC051411]|uniref:HAMP domain-containing protein n=1 Tax=Actinoplanes sp. NPDC051411 TaxID=3155522 RepID=UPI00343F3612